MRKCRLKITLQVVLFSCFCYYWFFKPYGIKLFKIRNFSINSLDKNATRSKKYFEDRNTSIICETQLVMWSEPIKPLYKLNPHKFLIPALTKGPTNQLFGFHQSVLLSILLNRTVVLPLFYQHEINENDGNRRIFAEERFNISKLREFVSLISLNEARKFCNNTFDAFFQASNLDMNSLVQHLAPTHLETGFVGLNYKAGVGLKNIKEFIESGGKDLSSVVEKEAESTLTGPFYRGFRFKDSKNISKVFSLYNSNEKCVFYCCPFRQLGVKLKNEISKSLSRNKQQEILQNPWDHIKSQEDAAILMKEIALHTPPVNNIKNLAESFRQKYLKTDQESKYLAIHWRYDEEDYVQYLCVDHFTPRRKESCESVRRAYNATLFARGVQQKVELLRQKLKLQSVYIAAPPSVRSFVEKVKILVKDLVQVKIVGGQELENFLTEKLKSCSWFENRGKFLDLLSSVELELCSGSDVFVWSQQSTWSQHALINQQLFYSKTSNDNEHVLGMILK